jgi:Protein of unknown function (DUF2849)
MAFQVITASLLKEGLVAYLCMDNDGASWTTDILKASSTETVAIEALQAEADRSDQQNIIVAAYAVDVEKTENGLVPVENRERIRANGPTVQLPINAASAASGQQAA